MKVDFGMQKVPPKSTLTGGRILATDQRRIKANLMVKKLYSSKPQPQELLNI